MIVVAWLAALAGVGFVVAAVLLGSLALLYAAIAASCLALAALGAGVWSHQRRSASAEPSRPTESSRLTESSRPTQSSAPAEPDSADPTGEPGRAVQEPSTGAEPSPGSERDADT